jgi:CubicO group peptidase (beta-lactamase class C family)
MRRRDLLWGGTALALRQNKLDEALALIEKAAAAGEVRTAALHVQQGRSILARAYGQARGPEEVFLLASISKPMTAAGVLILVDRGRLALDHPVGKYLPEFAGGDRDLVTVRHLLTHTSGLPDMLPENLELRKRFAPLSEFVARTCRTPLLFKPGTEVRYQSMGILLAAEIAQRLAGMPFRGFLQKELFGPLGMRRTSLGLGGRRISDTALCQVPDEPWGWNSPYWRELGAPWGGVHGSAGDVARFLRFFARPTGRVLRPAAVQAMVRSQTPVSKEAYGLGWRVTAGGFGRACSERTYGHSGSTGTMCWMDPARDLSFVLLTTRPLAESGPSLLRPVSDLVSESA